MKIIDELGLGLPEDKALHWAAAEYTRKEKCKGQLFSDIVKGIKCYECGFLNEKYREEDYTTYDRAELQFYYWCPKCFIRFKIPAALHHANPKVFILREGEKPVEIEW